MLCRLAFASVLTIIASTASWASDMIEKTSPHSVSDTIDRLEAAVTGAGATVFARVDHSAGAASVDLQLPASQLLIFGNPKLGTPAMQGGATAGLDLPLRVLAYADDEGVVHVVYHSPSTLAETHGLPTDAKYIQMMTGALDKLTGKAVAAD
ncbi:MAG: DUF302 domain-containing protein [Pseudomonadota bacterium]